MLPPGYSGFTLFLFRLLNPRHRLTSMSLKIARDQINHYESLLDQLCGAGDSERSQLLRAYAEDRKKSARAAENRPPSDSLLQADRPLNAAQGVNGTTDGSQQATLAVLGCGLPFYPLSARSMF